MIMPKNPSEWTFADIERITDALTLLQDYGIDTTSSSMSFAERIPPHLSTPLHLVQGE